MISFRCDRCGQLYRVRPEMAGVAGTCRRCGAELTTPAMSDVAAGDTDSTRKTATSSLLPILSQGAPPVDTPDVIPSEAVLQYLEERLGPIAGTFRDSTPRAGSIDVVQIPPTEKRPWRALVTVGMSRRPMAVPAEVAASPHLELLFALPADWPAEESEFQRPANFWPVQVLRALARLPHDAGSWLASGHVVPNGDPPRPYLEGSPFCAAVLLPPLSVEGGLSGFPIPGRRMEVLAVVPLHLDEWQFSLDRGVSLLLKRLDRAAVTDVLDPKRGSAIGRRWFR